MTATSDLTREQARAIYVRLAAIEMFLENTIADPKVGPARIHALGGVELTEEVSVCDVKSGLSVTDVFDLFFPRGTDDGTAFAIVEKEVSDLAARMLQGLPTMDVLRARADRLLAM